MMVPDHFPIPPLLAYAVLAACFIALACALGHAIADLRDRWRERRPRDYFTPDNEYDDEW